ncbi:MAG TPA: hypothetical protein VF215_01940, partial [Thermoanaerobaculia bacterium]
MHRHRHFLVAAAALLLSIPAFAADTVASLAEKYGAPRVGAAVTTHNQTFEFEHLKITFTDGMAAPVTAGDETIGLYFKGSGSYQYVSADPAEAAITATNLKRATKL